MNSDFVHQQRREIGASLEHLAQVYDKIWNDHAADLVASGRASFAVGYTPQNEVIVSVRGHRTLRTLQEHGFNAIPTHEGTRWTEMYPEINLGLRVYQRFTAKVFGHVLGYEEHRRLGFLSLPDLSYRTEFSHGDIYEVTAQDLDWLQQSLLEAEGPQTTTYFEF